MRSLLFASGVGLLAMLVAGPAIAQAQRPPIIKHVGVERGDLDLATPSGAEAMLAKMERAATRACGSPRNPQYRNSIGPLGREHHMCRIAAIDAATLQLGAPLVRAAWLERSEASEVAAARQASADLLGEMKTEARAQTGAN